MARIARMTRASSAGRVVHVEAAEEVAGAALELCQPERVG
jgi:hypothetical protein